MVIAVANQKGGVSKTTTVLNLAAVLSAAGKKVLVVDLDTQGDLTYSVGVSEAPEVENLYDFAGKVGKLIQSTNHGFDIIPASPGLFASESKQYDIDFGDLDYDYVIQDCPPNMGGNTIAALRAADSVIIPTTADVYSYKSVRAISESIHYLESHGAKTKIGGILVTRYAGRLIINKQIYSDLQNLAAEVGTKLYKTAIRESVGVRESQLMKQTVLEYDNHNAGAVDYTEFGEEILNE